MKNIVRLMFAGLLVVAAVIPGKAEVYKFEEGGNTRSLKQTTAGCSPSSAFEWLDINNVKTRINAGGDMWWDLPSGTGSKYFIPANGTATSLFAGSLWIAGVDINNQLKCAALRFRQVGNDYWTGPLTVDGTAAIDDVTCASWDKIWKITRAEVDEFLLHTDPITGYYSTELAAQDGYSIPKIIAEWPAHPETVGQTAGKVSKYMAPFFDNDGDGQYDPTAGDYPYYDINNELCHTKFPTMDEQEGYIHGSILADQVLKGDQTLWWVFNDKGNSHTESSGAAIGIEVRAQAFAFATNDEINNMTFYSYEIINRSTYELTGTYFSPWTDVDLGYGWDDYVGCDVSRGLGYGYNGNEIDGSGEPEAYGSQPPALGVDFFQGPYMDADGLDNPKYDTVWVPVVDYIDPVTFDTVWTYKVDRLQQLCDESINGVNFGNGIVDDERFGMRRFVYHDNSSAANGDPNTAPQYYNMLRGIWKDGSKMRYGGNAYSGSEVVGPECDFMFPDDSDPLNWGTGCKAPNGGYNQNGKYWNERSCNNSPNDRRFMQSAGPFTLKPGAVNYITFGVPWARATSGGAWGSVDLLRVVDDKCQALFDNCFKVIDGPNAPDLTIRELDQELIVYLSNTSISNNYKEGYTEIDPEIPDVLYIGTDTIYCDRTYRFEGYQVYQLANAEVSPDELGNTDKARLVFQCDVRNGVSRMVNYEYDNAIQANVPSLMVSGGDAGISHSFVITEDKFSTTDNPALVNFKPYYFMAVAYAYNNYYTYSQEPGDLGGLYGQMKPYLEGRKNIQCYTAIPHKTINGTVLRSTYGDSPAVKRIVGVGNGGNEIELDEETVKSILFDETGAPKMASKKKKVTLGHPDYPIAYHPQYKVGYSPINVKIIDPLNVINTNYELWFDSLKMEYTYNVVDGDEVHIPTGDDPQNPVYVKGSRAPRMVSHWFLKDVNSQETYKSDTTTIYTDEKMFIDRGISVSITQSYEIGPIEVGKYYDSPDWKASYAIVAKENGMITSSIEFTDPTKPWLDGIRDKDVPGTVINWVRAGTYIDQDDVTNSDYLITETYSKPYDPNQNYEKVANGTWAPYILCSFNGQGGKWNPGPVFNANSRVEEYFRRTASVDIVLTSDRSKWTRCPVVEMCMDDKISEGNARRFGIRKHASVDKNGKFLEGDYTQIQPSENPEDPNYIAAQGMGWFPGYVIDVESGARLNIVFGEDSYLADQNGNDMLFNPTKLLKNTINETNGDYSQLMDPNIIRNYGVDDDPVMGGKHFVYIWGMDKGVSVGNFPYKDFDSPAYDGGQYLYNVMNYLQQQNTTVFTLGNTILYRQAMWIGMPMGIEGTEWLPEGNDCRIRIRVGKPYAPGYAPITLDTLAHELMINDLNPKYEFSISGLEPEAHNAEKTETDLDLITIVPNPYYAYSEYEGNALTNKVKITNLPEKCVVTIYTISGTKVRQFKKDSQQTYLEWDLTNFANTPIASGFYLIHVKDYTSNHERVIKFFGAMRKVDLNTF